jgi:Acyclic terpene utilisation family protein AtuA
MTGSRVRIGCGSAYAEDRIDLAADMVDRGGIGYLCMDGLAERTLALAHLRRAQASGEHGYDVRIPQLVSEVLPLALEREVTIIGNVGAADPEGAGDFISQEAKRQGLHGIRVGVVTGDEVLEQVRRTDPLILETGGPASALPGTVIAANAYIGAEPIVAALRDGANVIVGGRIADPSVFVAPIVHEFGWSFDDWNRLGTATAVAHLLECGNHVTGGNFADPPYRIVESFRRPSFPLAEVRPDGSALISKLPDTDGLLSVETCKMQLGYEIHDPARYLTPDVSADFTQVTLTSTDGGIEVAGAAGTRRPDRLKVLVAIDEGFIGEGQVSFAGPGALDRARLGEEIVRSWLAPVLESGSVGELRIDLLGVNALLGPASEPAGDPYEVHLRVAGRSMDRAVAERIADAGWYLQVFGPAAVGGHRKLVRPVVAMYTCFLPRDEVATSVDIL